jgi:hypothetical protein
MLSKPATGTLAFGQTTLTPTRTADLSTV